MKIILVIVLVSLSGIASGQSYLGAFAGANTSRLTGDSPSNAKYKGLWGVNTGLYLDIKLSKMIWLSLQPSYSQEGTRIEYSVKGKIQPVDSIHIRLNYFALPVLLKISSTNGRFYAIGGIETSALLDHSLKSHDQELEEDINVTDWNLAIHFGAGIRIPIGYPRLFIELRYTQGFIDLTDEPVENSYVPRVKTIGFKALAGIEIPLTRNNK
jgi:hypothetical protein